MMGLPHLAAPGQGRDGSDNANSIVLLLSLGEFQFFEAGDLTWINFLAPSSVLYCPGEP
ncbi:MAG: hypothetical protein ACREHD_15510 [Pirellulales bacterium]